MKYLINSGVTFHDAKTQAHQEVLAIFDISNDKSVLPEQMDISKGGDDNAILLAVSVVLQGNNSTAELSEFINRISADIREDGILDNQGLGTELINSVNHTNMEIIRDHLETRYSELTEEYIIPDFEKYITMFINSTSFIATNDITFPPVGTYGNNSLHPDTIYVEASVYTTNVKYSLCADIPEGRSFTVRITGEMIGVSRNDIKNMEYVRSSDNQILTVSSIASGICDMRVSYLRDYDENPTEQLLFEYFSDGTEDPYFTKYLTVTDENNPPPDSTYMK